MDKQLLNIADISKALNIPKSTLYSYVSEKEIPHLKILGKVMFEQN